MKAEPFSIVTRLDRRLRKGDQVESGVFFVKHGRRSFPAKGWRSFPALVVDWWTLEILDLLFGGVRKVRLDVMSEEMSGRLFWIDATVKGDWLVLRAREREGRKKGRAGQTRLRWTGKVLRSTFLLALRDAYIGLDGDARKYRYPAKMARPLKASRITLVQMCSLLSDAHALRTWNPRAPEKYVPFGDQRNDNG